MNKAKKKMPALLFFWVGFSLVQLSVAQRNCSIQGRVIDEKGLPVPAAQVSVDPLAEGPHAEVVRTVETDKDGHFLVPDLEPVTYKVFAAKESSGYPNTAFAFYSNQAFPTVTLTKAIPAAEILLKIGPPTGVVVGTTRDAATGESVNATFLLRRASNFENWISTSQPSAYRILVPPDVDVLLEVSAPGYKTWYYGELADPRQSSTIRLESGKEMKLNVQLEPINPSEKQQK